METLSDVYLSILLNALETFLVEWKLFGFHPVDFPSIFLETFLVEWKLRTVQDTLVFRRDLETFLVEWKHSSALAVMWKLVSLKPS